MSRVILLTQKEPQLLDYQKPSKALYLDLVLEGGEGGADGEQDEQHEEQQKGDCHLGEGIMRIREMEMMSTRRATAK